MAYLKSLGDLDLELVAIITRNVTTIHHHPTMKLF